MGLLIGFSTILVVVLCGVALAHEGVLDARSQRTLAEVGFFVASPALMVTTISEVQLDAALNNLAASVTALSISMLLYVVIARGWWRLDTGPVLIGALCASVVNAGTLGLAIAAYVVGDITVVVPTILAQMLLVQPPALIILDRLNGLGEGALRALRRIVTNPITLAGVAGILLAATGWQLPQPVEQPLDMLAGAAIPISLLTYGAGLRLSPRLGRTGHNREVLVATIVKMLFMPLVAWLAGSALGLEGAVLLGVVLTAALPAAQNTFMHATRYRIGEDIARETILVTTLLSLPATLLVVLVLA